MHTSLENQISLTNHLKDVFKKCVNYKNNTMEVSSLVYQVTGWMCCSQYVSLKFILNPCNCSSYGCVVSDSQVYSVSTTNAYLNFPHNFIFALKHLSHRKIYCSAICLVQTTLCSAHKHSTQRPITRSICLINMSTHLLLAHSVYLNHTKYQNNKL